jgi:hypothetical protein
MSQHTVMLRNEAPGTSRKARQHQRIFQEGFQAMQERCWAEAERCFSRVIGMTSKNAVFAALANRGITRHFLGRPEEALADYARAMTLGDPALKKLIRINRGVLLAALRRYDEALADFLSDGSEEGKLNAAFVYLVHGDYDTGLRLYRARKDVERWGFGPPPPLEELLGKDVLIIHEQGLGDSIMMSRFVPHLTGAANSVAWATQKSLIPLFQQIPGVQFIEANDSTAPRLRYEVNHGGKVGILVMDLLMTFAGLYGDGKPYLKADPELMAKSRDCLPGRRKIGLAWRGNTGFNNDHNRSMPFELLKPLLDAYPAVTFVSLQVPAEPQPGVVGVTLTDFAQTAATIACLDAVVSVDTAVAHLAGALGIPCALLVAYSPDWRWGLEGERTPWYDSLRIFRQPAYRDWQSVVAEVVRCGFLQ